MASLSLHNVVKVHASGNTFKDFCTLKLNVTTQHKSDKAPIFEHVEFYFNDEEARQAFIESIVYNFNGA